MTQKLMISYSRSQTPFVNQFYQELDKAGYSIWLDYRNIVPARPWLDQIHEGIDRADTLLLVISQESIASVHVLEEWEYALRKDKRVILVIFDAVDLSKRPELTEEDLASHPQLRDLDPAKLTKMLRESEWVDFRLRYRKSLERLKALLEGKEPQEKSAKKKSNAWGRDNPPERGFKAPLTFWIAFLLSFLVVVSSIISWWTIFIPYVLAPLPLQIYKRNYSLSRIVPALLFMPVVVLATIISMQDAGNILHGFQNISDSTPIFVALESWLLLGLLFTPAMQRRARPEAAIVRFARNHIKEEVRGSENISFVIEHAPEDGRCAEYLRRGLVGQGYRETGKNETPNAVFVIISSYNKSTVHDPGKVPVFPILLQATKNLQEDLARIQWIDYRRGIRNTNKLARLLQNPVELLKEVAIAPTGNGEIFPLVVNVLQYFYLITGILGGGALLIYLASFARLLIQRNITVDASDVVRLILTAVEGLLLLGAVIYAVRPLRSREGSTAGAYPLLILTIFQSVCFLFFLMVLFGVDNARNELIEAGNQLIYSALVFPLGLVIVLPFLLLRGGELYRWLPRHTKDPTDKIERALLLYSPRQRRMLVYHILFHGSLIFTYLIILAFTLWPDTSVAACTVPPLVLIVLGTRWMAWRAYRKTGAVLTEQPG